MRKPCQQANIVICLLFLFLVKKKLVIACDSTAGIGEKQQDIVEIDPAITAAYCLRVPLMELFCFGAEPIAVIDLIGNEYETTGRRMLKGIKKELEKQILPIYR